MKNSNNAAKDSQPQRARSRATRKLGVKYAFWPYDLFPFVLSSETDGRRDKQGTVSVPAYGIGARVKPLVVLSAEEGQRVKEGLAQVKGSYERAKADLYRGAVIKATALHPFLVKVFAPKVSR